MAIKRKARTFLNSNLEDGMLSSVGFSFDGDLPSESKYPSFNGSLEMKACGSGYVAFDFSGDAHMRDVNKALAKLQRMQRVLTKLELALLDYKHGLKGGRGDEQ